jgi:TPR repeat protein
MGSFVKEISLLSVWSGSAVRLLKALGVTSVAATVLVTVCFWPSSPILAAEPKPATTLRNLGPKAMNGNREALRKAAKAISKIGPREFESASQIRPLLRNEAMRGSSAAANAYAMMLQYGIGGPASPKEAPAWYARGGRHGNASASKSAALAYALGWGVKRNTTRALQLLAKIPTDQQGRKMLAISKALLLPGQEEPQVAFSWLQRAIALDPNGDLSATEVYEVIATHLPDGDAQLLAWLKPLAEKGNVGAVMVVAKRLTATGSPTDLAEAVRLYMLAADKDEIRAYENLTSLLATAPADTSQTILTFLEEKATGGSNMARVVLGNFYLFKSVASDGFRARGLDYLQHAARDGSSDAQYRLGMLLLGAQSDQTQYSLANAYLVLSAKAGNLPAEIAAAHLSKMSVDQAREIAGVKLQ